MSREEVDHAMLLYLKARTTGQLQQDIGALVQASPKRILSSAHDGLYTPFPRHRSLAYTFSYATWSKLLAQHPPPPPPGSSSQALPCYSLTPDTLEYLRARSSPLVATLASLMATRGKRGNEEEEGEEEEERRSCYPVSTVMVRTGTATNSANVVPEKPTNITARSVYNPVSTMISMMTSTTPPSASSPAKTPNQTQSNTPSRSSFNPVSTLMTMMTSTTPTTSTKTPNQAQTNTTGTPKTKDCGSDTNTIGTPTMKSKEYDPQYPGTMPPVPDPRFQYLHRHFLSACVPLRRAYDPPSSESRTSESRTSESRTSESRTSESRISKSRISESRISESRISESRISESRTSESHTESTEPWSADSDGIGKVQWEEMMGGDVPLPPPYNDLLNTALLASPHSQQYKHILMRLFERCAWGNRYRPLAALFRDLNPVLFDDDPQMRLLRDLVFSAAAASLGHKQGEEKEREDKEREEKEREGREESEQAWHYFMAIKDVDLKTRVTLSCLGDYDVETCVRLLQGCLAEDNMNTALRNLLQDRLDFFFICKQVIAYATQKQHEQSSSTTTSAQDDFPYASFTSWAGVEAVSLEKPSVVLELLLDAGLHAPARRWAGMVLEGEADTLRGFHALIHQSHLCYLLRKEDIGYSEAHMFLDELPRDSVLPLCEQILSILPAPAQQLFIVDYMLRKMAQDKKDKKDKDTLDKQDTQDKMDKTDTLDKKDKTDTQDKNDDQAKKDKTDSEDSQDKLDTRDNQNSQSHLLTTTPAVENSIKRIKKKSVRLDLGEEDTDDTSSFSSSWDDKNKEGAGGIKDRARELEVLRVGCRAVLALPERARAEYQHLVSAPLLILEMLLMNNKVEWAGLVVAVLRENLCHHITEAACNALIVTYTKKALDFCILTPQDEPTAGVMSRSPSRASLGPGSALWSQQQQQQQRRQSIAVPSSSVGAHRERTLSSLRQASLPALDAPPTTPGGGAKGGGTKGGGGFVMPREPPTKEQWVPDSEADVCMVCKMEHFGMFCRRHHCRRCGRVVCASCSARTTTVRGVSSRTCDQCYEQTFMPKEDEQRRIQRLRDKMAAASSPPIQFSVGGSPPTADSPTPSPSAPSYSSQGGGEYSYRLSLDLHGNEAVRDDFYYEHAPSTSLCLALVALHSDPDAAGHVLLQLCHSVSTVLQPLPDGSRNHEVDYGLVVSMLRQLVKYAKLRFSLAEDGAGIAKCDLLLDRISLLKSMVAEYCTLIPSLAQLDNIDAVRSLRSRLITEDRMALALEVSRRYQLDDGGGGGGAGGGVWVSWGVAYLSVGDYAGARQKLGQLLRGLSDARTYTSLSSGTGKIIGDVLAALERAPPPANASAQKEELLSLLRGDSDDALLAEPPPRARTQLSGVWGAVTEESVLATPQMQESLYYLRTYGSPTHMLAFFRTHHCLTQAVHWLLEKKLSGDEFVEHLLLPCIRDGSLKRLLDSMQHTDGSLLVWGKYLTAAFIHLSNTKAYHSLYHIQCFTKDHVRAAMTCIVHFFRHGARSYLGLGANLPALTTARAHFQRYLDDKLWQRPGAGAGKAGAGKGAAAVFQPRIMSPVEVHRNLLCIDLQVDVTRHIIQYHEYFESLHRAATESATGSRSGSASRSMLTMAESMVGSEGEKIDSPTLFDSTKRKQDLTGLLLMCGNHVNDGYGLAFRIIQQLKLDANGIYTQVARSFGEQRRVASLYQLSECVRDSGLYTDSHDALIMAGIQGLADRGPVSQAVAKDVEGMIKTLKDEQNKVNGYIMIGKLKTAYLAAVKRGSVEDVRRIFGEAQRLQQQAVMGICQKWLKQKGLSVD